jgi:hypothetical protein
MPDTIQQHLHGAVDWFEYGERVVSHGAPSSYLSCFQSSLETSRSSFPGFGSVRTNLFGLDRRWVDTVCFLAAAGIPVRLHAQALRIGLECWYLLTAFSGIISNP